MFQRPNRRQFLKSTAALAFIPWGWKARGILGANDKLRVGCIGIEGRGAGNVDGVAGENVVGLCDIQKSFLDGKSERFKEAKLFFDYREMIDTLNLDAVVIATPDHHHAPAAYRALQKGLHVYCEKPLTHTVHEARVLATLAREKGLITQLGTQNHHHPVNLEAQAILKSGVLGQIREVHVITDRPGGWWKQGLERPKETPAVPEGLEWNLFLGPAPERPYHPVYHPFHWRGWWDFGCGAVGDMAIHLMDLAVYALDLDAPARVSATGGPLSAESGPKHMSAVFDYDAKGARAALKVYWYEGEAKAPEDIAKDLPMNGSLFIGEHGRLAVNHTVWTKLLPEGKFKDFKKLGPFPKLTGHHKEWLEAIRAKGKASCDFSNAGPFTETVLLANVAFRTGKTIVWNPKTMTADGVPEASAFIKKNYRKGWEVG